MKEVQRESHLLLLRYFLMIIGKNMFWYILGTGTVPFLIFFQTLIRTQNPYCQHGYWIQIQESKSMRIYPGPDPK